MIYEALTANKSREDIEAFDRILVGARTYGGARPAGAPAAATSPTASTVRAASSGTEALMKTFMLPTR